MVVQILVAERQGVKPLRHQFGHPVFDETRVALVDEATRQGARETDRAVHLAQEQHAAVAAQVTAAEIGDDRAFTKVLKLERSLLTLCFRPGVG